MWLYHMLSEAAEAKTRPFWSSLKKSLSDKAEMAGCKPAIFPRHWQAAKSQ
jgi:hypothetical protein